MIVQGKDGEEILCIKDEEGNLVQCFDDSKKSSSWSQEEAVFPKKLNLVVKRNFRSR